MAGEPSVYAVCYEIVRQSGRYKLPPVSYEESRVVYPTMLAVGAYLGLALDMPMILTTPSIWTAIHASYTTDRTFAVKVALRVYRELAQGIAVPALLVQQAEREARCWTAHELLRLPDLCEQDRSRQVLMGAVKLAVAKTLAPACFATNYIRLMEPDTMG